MSRQESYSAPERFYSLQVAPRYIGAAHEPGQHLCHRVPSVAGSGLSGTGTPACALCMECISHGTGRSACATISRLVHEQEARTCGPRSAAFLWILEFAWVEIGRTEKAGQL